MYKDGIVEQVKRFLNSIDEFVTGDGCCFEMNFFYLIHIR